MSSELPYIRPLIWNGNVGGGSRKNSLYAPLSVGSKAIDGVDYEPQTRAVELCVKISGI